MAAKTSSPPILTPTIASPNLKPPHGNKPNSLFINSGAGRFRDATAESGLAGAAAVHRGCGVADFNNDGRLDIAVLVLGAQAELWQNDTAPDHRWLIVRLVGTKSNRDGIGARVLVGNQVRTMTTAVGYASSSHAGMHFGLGNAHGDRTRRSAVAVRHAPDRREGQGESGD